MLLVLGQILEVVVSAGGIAVLIPQTVVEGKEGSGEVKSWENANWFQIHQKNHDFNGALS